MLYAEKVESVEKELETVRAQVPSRILEVKHDLLSVYLMNLVLYHELREEDRSDSPITEVLIKTTILLEKVCLLEQKAAEAIKEELTRSEDAGKKETAKEERTLPDRMLRDKGAIVKRKAERRTPARGYRDKAQKLAEAARTTYDDSIDAKRTRTSKFE
jgi:hypothetical protein